MRIGVRPQRRRRRIEGWDATVSASYFGVTRRSGRDGRPFVTASAVASSWSAVGCSLLWPKGSMATDPHGSQRQQPLSHEIVESWSCADDDDASGAGDLTSQSLFYVVPSRLLAPRVGKDQGSRGVGRARTSSTVSPWHERSRFVRKGSSRPYRVGDRRLAPGWPCSARSGFASMVEDGLREIRVRIGARRAGSQSCKSSSVARTAKLAGLAQVCAVVSSALCYGALRHASVRPNRVPRDAASCWQLLARRGFRRLGTRESNRHDNLPRR